MERSKAGTKKRSPDGLSLIIKIQNNNKHNMVKIYKKWKKDNEIQFTKKKMDFNNGKKSNYPPIPGILK